MSGFWEDEIKPSSSSANLHGLESGLLFIFVGNDHDEPGDFLHCVIYEDKYFPRK